jgi:hypothetical protein
MLFLITTKSNVWHYDEIYDFGYVKNSDFFVFSVDVYIEALYN